MNEIPNNKNKNPPARMPIFFKKDDKLMFFFTGLIDWMVQYFEYIVSGYGNDISVHFPPSIKIDTDRIA